MPKNQTTDAPPTFTAEPTETALPQVTLDETSTPETYPTPLLPEFLETNFLLEESPRECQLPCWHGLVAGQSTLPDVEEFFQTEMGFGEDFDILAHPMPETYSSPDIHEDEISIIHEWEYSEGGPFLPELVLGFRFERKTQILQHIYFGINRFENLPLASVVREIGVPDFILATFGLGQGDGRFDLKLIYEDGMIWYYRHNMYFDEADSDNDGFAELCFGSDYEFETLMLISPLAHGLHGISKYQERAIEHRVSYGGIEPIEDVFGFTKEELSTGLIEDGDYCLSIDVRH